MTTTMEPPRLSPPPPEPRPAHAGHVVMFVGGVLLSLLGLVLAALASASGWGLLQQRDGRFITSPTERYVADSYALTTTELEVLVDDELPARRPDLAEIMVRATGADASRPVFLGIGPREEVASYLAGSAHTELARVTFAPFRPVYRTVPGTGAPGRPGDQDFWTASAAGTGTQQLQIPLQSGTWVVVVMNVDGSSGLAADISAGARSELLAPVTWGLGAGAVVLLGAGVALLVTGAAGLGRRAALRPAQGSPAGAAASAAGTSAPSASAVGRYHSPTRVTGDLEPVSRWLWLVKWLLAIPHALVLVVLWPAAVVVTLVAAVAILITGRYPRPLFDFTVGVLRWSWRVGFYAYDALGTDRYPPFTLARTDYPADLDVEYPEHLSRGLVLVKSWLLAIPHLVVVGLLTAPWYWVVDPGSSDAYRENAGISLLGLLTLVAALVLLFTGRYPRALFDLVVGINRWVYRVLVYVALLRDEYPPFRLDQGAREPDDPATANAELAAGLSDPDGGHRPEGLPSP